MNIRERFEEIWPVPEGIEWSMNIGAYVCNDAIRITQELINKCAELDARLDTFTRCQESMFSKEELNLLQQWFNAVEDLNPIYLEKSDCDLYRKIMERLK